MAKELAESLQQYLGNVCVTQPEEACLWFPRFN